MPEYNTNKIKSNYAYAVKIEGFGRFASKPQIKIEYKPGELKPTVTMSADMGNIISFSIDGSDPLGTSRKYEKPFIIDKTITLKAISVFSSSLAKYQYALPSAIVSQEVKVYEWKNAIKVSKPKPGIAYKYFEPTAKIDLSSINNNPTSTGIADIISNNKKQRTDKFAFEFTGYIKIEKDNIYTLFTDSDDGSMLYIDEEEIVNNDGNHGNVEKNGKAALKKGFHKIKVLYFDSGGGNSLKVSMQPEGGKKEAIPAALLFH